MLTVNTILARDIHIFRVKEHNMYRAWWRYYRTD